jgi:pimeloyl-ACP methyl ester carboxylesterase
MHGWPQHWWSWRELIGPLSERYRVICPDTRGMGWTSAPRHGYGARDLADDLHALLDVLGLDGVRLVGHDWQLLPGYIACFDTPDRFKRFVPMGGVHPWSAEGAPARAYVRPWHLYASATPAGRLLTERLGLPEICLRDWRRAGRYTREEIEIYAAPLRRPASARATMLRDREIVTREIPYFVRHRSRFRLRVKTLHLDGEHDPLAAGTPDSWRRYADDMERELIPGSGHFMAEERPKWVAERMLAFFE